MEVDWKEADYNGAREGKRRKGETEDISAEGVYTMKENSSTRKGCEDSDFFFFWWTTNSHRDPFPWARYLQGDIPKCLRRLRHGE